MNGIAVLQMLTFMKYENLERKWGNLGFKITENVLRLYLSLLCFSLVSCSSMKSSFVPSWRANLGTSSSIFFNRKPRACCPPL